MHSINPLVYRTFFTMIAIRRRFSIHAADSFLDNNHQPSYNNGDMINVPVSGV